MVSLSALGATTLSDNQTMQLVAGVTDRPQDIDELDFDLYHPSFTSSDSFAARHLPPPATTDGELLKRR
jgi:hypothetical protein